MSVKWKNETATQEGAEKRKPKYSDIYLFHLSRKFDPINAFLMA